MLLFLAQAEIVNRPGEYALLEAAFDGAHYAAVGRSNLSPHRVLFLDESTLDNQSRATDVFNQRVYRDFRNLGKYYGKLVGQTVQLWERGGWRRAPEVYDPTQFQDVQIVLARSPERASFQETHVGMVARLQQIRQNPPANLQQLFVGVQDVAMFLEILIGLARRLEKPD